VQESPRRVVALKVIRPELALLGSLQRFRREAEILGAMQHPGIAHVFEAGLDERSGTPWPYMAMELVEGEKLTAFAHRRRLSPSARVALLLRVCDAVHHAHQRGVIHRDLKPANVLVDGTSQPKVLDFGIARALESAAGALELPTLVPIGTPAYMSPEQREGAAVVDVRSDVYSLGVLGFELLTGGLPRELEAGANARGAAPAPRDAAERRASSFGGLRGDLCAVFARALHADRELRYQSASALADDLHRFLDGRPVLARGASAGYVALKLACRNKKSFAAGALAALVASFAWTGPRVERSAMEPAAGFVLGAEGAREQRRGGLAPDAWVRGGALPQPARPSGAQAGARRGERSGTWIEKIVVVRAPAVRAAGPEPLPD
jgi:hypothetical protein